MVAVRATALMARFGWVLIGGAIYALNYEGAPVIYYVLVTIGLVVWLACSFGTINWFRDGAWPPGWMVAGTWLVPILVLAAASSYRA